jgi:uncharacterized Tic20 family protein
MAISGLILGVINIGIVVALLLILGLAIVWLIKAFGGPELDPQIKKFYLLFVLLVAIYMLVALIFGMPSVRILGSGSVPPFRG